MVIYFGTYSRTLDEKGRLLIPCKLRGNDIDHLYILKGFEGCISVYEEEAFQKLLGKLQAMDYNNEESRTYMRLAFASIQKLDLDCHGRILLGKDLLADYRIKNDVTIIGVLDHFEIWDATSYASYLLQNSNNYETLAGKSH